MEEEWIRTDFKPVDKRDPIGKVVGWLRGENAERPIVLDRKQPYGIVDGRRVLGTRVRHDTRVEKAALPVPILHREDGAEVVAAQFDETLASYLPVRGNEGKPVAGFVDPTLVLAAWDDGPTAGEAAVEVPHLRPLDTLAQAERHFASSNVDHLPVVDDGGRVVGVLPQRVLLRVEDFEDQGRNRKDAGGSVPRTKHTQVRGEMEGGWSEISPDAGLDEVAKQFTKRTYVLVLDRKGRVQGALTAPLALRAVRRFHAPPPPPRQVPAYRRR